MALKITDDETKILTDFFKGNQELNLEVKAVLIPIYNKYFGTADAGDNNSQWRHYLDNLKPLVKIK